MQLKDIMDIKDIFTHKSVMPLKVFGLTEDDASHSAKLDSLST